MSDSRPIQHLNRRRFLRGFAGTTIALPFLESFASSAHARTSKGQARGDSLRPQRFVVMMYPQGTVKDAWLPSATGTDYTLPPLLAPLSDVQEHLTVMSGINNTVSPVNALSNGHNSPARTLLTCMPFADNMDPSGNLLPSSQQVDNGRAGGPSIDQEIAARIGQETRFASLDLGVGGPTGIENDIFFAAKNDPITLEHDPKSVFLRLFFQPDENSSSALDRLRAKRASVLDGVGVGLQAMRNRVSGQDKIRIEAHLDKIRELEMRLTGTSNSSASCTQPTMSLSADYNPTQSDFDVQTAPAMIELASMAMACDLTRVVTLQFTDGQAPRFPWLGADIPGGWDSWHSMIHEARDSGGREAMLSAMTWYTEQFASLVRRLNEFEDGDGTLLDNSLVTWLSEFGDGSVHSPTQLPIVAAGQAGGTLASGQHHDLSGRTTGELYATYLNMFGFDDQSFGMPQHCNGVISDLL